MQPKNNLFIFSFFVICVFTINCDTENDENLKRSPRTGRLGLLGYLSGIGFKAANAIRNEYLYGRPWRASIHVETHWPPYTYPHPYYPPHAYPPYPYPMNGFGPNQRPLPPPSYGGGGGGGGVGLSSGYFDVTENQAQADNMVNSVIKPSTRLNKLELNSSKKNEPDESEDIIETVNRTVRTVPDLQDSFIENRKLTISSNVSNEVSLTDKIDKTSNVSVANNSTINVSITEEKEPTIEQPFSNSETTQLPIIIEPTTLVSFSKPNNGYIYYKNSRYNRANEIFITTDFPQDQTGRIFKPSRLDDFRNKIESVR